MAKHKLLQGRKTGRLNTPTNVLKAAQGKIDTSFKRITRPSTPSPNPSKITRSVLNPGGVAAGKFVTESRIRAHTRAKTSLLPGQNTTDTLKSRPSKFKLNAASIVTQVKKAKAGLETKLIFKEGQRLGLGGKVGSANSTTNLINERNTLRIQNIGPVAKKAAATKAATKAKSLGGVPSSPLSATRGPLKQTSQARKFIAQTGKAATAAKASSAITASAKGGTSTTRITARRTTNPNAANLALGKGQASKGLSVGGAGRPPQPTPAGVESEFKRGGSRATSRGEGTKGLNVGGVRRPGGTISLRGTRELRSPLGTFRGLR